MKRELQGHYVIVPTVGEKGKAFVPAPLPPRPPVDWTPELRNRFDKAWLALGRLDSVSTLLPDTALFLYMYVRKEAVLSSMIDGRGHRSPTSCYLLHRQSQSGISEPDDIYFLSVTALAAYRRIRQALLVCLNPFDKL